MTEKKEVEAKLEKGEKFRQRDLLSVRCDASLKTISNSLVQLTHFSVNLRPQVHCPLAFQKLPHSQVKLPVMLMFSSFPLPCYI